MEFIISASELQKALKKISLSSNPDLIWISAEDGKTSIDFRTKMKSGIASGAVISSGNIQIKGHKIQALNVKLNPAENVLFRTDGKMLIITNGNFILQFDYLTEFLADEEKRTKKEDRSNKKFVKAVDKKKENWKKMLLD